MHGPHCIDPHLVPMSEIIQEHYNRYFLSPPFSESTSEADIGAAAAKV